jgi:hypothetical protein
MSKQYILKSKDVTTQPHKGERVYINGERVHHKGTYEECLAKFHKLCGFSFANHKQYSFTQYEIKECDL